MLRPAALNLRSMIRLGIRVLSLALLVTACSGPDDAVGPSPLDPPTPQITSVRVTPTAYMVAVGSTTEMTVVVLADSGVQYTVAWSLPAGSAAATIDTGTGALTAVAPGFASPRACATARLQTVCGEANVRLVTTVTAGGDRGLAFVREGTVFLSALDGSEAVALVTEAARPAWSPDGARIAFTRPAANLLTRWQLCIAREDGSDIRCATGGADGMVVGGPSWSPDGAMVAFSFWTHDCPNGQCGQFGGYFSGLSLLNTLTMEVETFDTPPVSALSWSPNGRKIAVAMFGVGRFGRGALGVVNPDGTGLETLANSLGSYSVAEVAWSPDAGRLALTLQDENACPWYCDTAIGVINADGTQLRLLDKAQTSEDVYLWAPAWAPDGARLAYTVSRGDECTYDRVPCGSDIAVVRVDGGPIELLISAGGFPSWRQ
jgi:Tol biopolymer transport system component